MYLRLPSANIYYKIKGAGRPVVVLHGFPLDHHVMETALEPVFKKVPGFKRIYLDLPAMGMSGATNKMNSTKKISEAVEEFISLLTKNEKIVLIGFSYGAYLARLIATAMPEKIDGIIFIAPVVIADREQRTLPRHRIAVGKGLKLKLNGPLEKELFDELVVRKKSVWNKIKRVVLPSLRKGNKDLQSVIYEKNYSVPGTAFKNGRFKGPVLIITGRNDSTVGYKDIEKIAPSFPNHIHFDLRDAGHYLLFEQQKKVTAILIKWLSLF